VTQILPTGFARHPFRRSGRIQQRLAWCLEVLMGLAIWVFASFASAQATPGPSRQERKDKPAAPVVMAPVQQPAHPVVPIYGAAAPEQTLPEPPQVFWDGKQLTIDAENSKLSDVLLAVRAKTGASVDFPAGAATMERVAVHLGPAPVREVLSSLLYGTDFDYIISAPPDDEDGLRSVVLTERGKGSDDVVLADAPADTSEHPGVRLMPGYSAPGKRSFQAAAEAAAAEATAQSDQPVSAAESAPVGADAQSSPGSAPSGAESANSQPPSTDQSPTPAADEGLAGGMPATRSTISSTASAAPSPDGSPLPQMIQDMQHLFQQRAQIQAQQNQAAAKPPTN